MLATVKNLIFYILTLQPFTLNTSKNIQKYVNQRI